MTVIEWGHLLGEDLPDSYLELEIQKEDEVVNCALMLKVIDRNNFLRSFQMEYELCIREAEVQDATDLIAFLNLVSKETDLLV